MLAYQLREKHVGVEVGFCIKLGRKGGLSHLFMGLITYQASYGRSNGAGTMQPVWICPCRPF